MIGFKDERGWREGALNEEKETIFTYFGVLHILNPCFATFFHEIVLRFDELSKEL